MRHPQQTDNCNCRQMMMLVDGVPLRGGAAADYTLQAALEGLDPETHALLAALRDRSGPELGVIDSHFDDGELLFARLGFRTRQIAGEDLGESAPRVVAICCPHRNARLDEIDTFRFLQRGGVLISSDRAIRLPGIARFIGHLGGRPPARARIDGDDVGNQPYSAPVWLDPGHVPIDPAALDKRGVVRLASDALTGEPLVVYYPTGRGGILHSVAHWLQVPHPQLLTGVERRPLRSVPDFRAIGNSYPNLQLGGFLAQRAMLTLLVRGLAELLKTERTADQPTAQARVERGK